MLRVIIADDEEHICQLIQILADWKRLGMELVGVARNGPDALELVERQMPDILITDIRMPGFDGLEVIRRARELSVPPEIIIISGYAQFDYAQTAIQYGVGEYLLKPINKDALNATLEKLGERCMQQRMAQRDMENLRTATKSDRERLRLVMIADLLDGRLAEISAELLEKSYYFLAAGCVVQAFVFKMDYDWEQYGEQSLAILRDKVHDVFSPLLCELCQDYLIYDRDAAVYGVMSYQAQRQGGVRGALRDALNRLVAMKSLFGPVVFSLALGTAETDASGLPGSMESACERIMERLTEGTERMLEGHAEASELRGDELLAHYAQGAAQAIDVMSAREARTASEILREGALAVPRVRGRELLKLAKDAGIVFATRLGMDNREQALAQYGERLSQVSRADDLFCCLARFQDEQLAAAQEYRRGEAAQPIRQAKQYIQKHFAGAITLEEVSAASGFSVSYFSTLFKKETGEGFTKYLTRVRMEEARNLLRETRLSVAEICARVGYGDVKHFTHTFKAATGLTPGEFRKLYG